MTTPSAVRVAPYIWHGEGDHKELCITITANSGRRVIIPARQLREVAAALHDRADEAEVPYPPKENTTMSMITEEQHDQLMIRAMTEARHAREAEARIEQHVARIGYLEHLLSIREEQLEQLRGAAKVVS